MYIKILVNINIIAYLVPLTLQHMLNWMVLRTEQEWKISTYLLYIKQYNKILFY